MTATTSTVGDGFLPGGGTAPVAMTGYGAPPPPADPPVAGSPASRDAAVPPSEPTGEPSTDDGSITREALDPPTRADDNDAMTPTAADVAASPARGEDTTAPDATTDHPADGAAHPDAAEPAGAATTPAHSLEPSATDAARAAAATAVVAAGGAAGRRPWSGMRFGLGAIAATIALVIAVGASLLGWQRADRLEREAARRLQTGEQRVVEVEQQLRLSQDSLRDVQNRAAVLENKLSEAIGQQVQLERRYKDIATDGIDVVLADVETSVSLAAQQLVLGGNVQGALAALQEAEGRLRRSSEPVLINVRRVVERDIDRLKAVPAVDLTSLALRIDTLIASIDTLPMLASAAAGSPAPADEAEAEGDGAGDALDRLASRGRRGWDALRSEFQELFRVRRVDAPEAAMLAPEQSYFVRENLRLTLLGARLALLSRNQAVFRADLDRASRWIGTYYDRQSRGVGNVLATLQQLQSSQVSVEVPGLSDSLNAVRAARSAREQR